MTLLDNMWHTQREIDAKNSYTCIYFSRLLHNYNLNIVNYKVNCYNDVHTRRANQLKGFIEGTGGATIKLLPSQGTNMKRNALETNVTK